MTEKVYDALINQSVSIVVLLVAIIGGGHTVLYRMDKMEAHAEKQDQKVEKIADNVSDIKLELAQLIGAKERGDIIITRAK